MTTEELDQIDLNLPDGWRSSSSLIDGVAMLKATKGGRVVVARSVEGLAHRALEDDGQGDLFPSGTVDPSWTGEGARDEAIARVEVAADEQWKEAARDAVRMLAASVAEFTTDDVWQAMGMPWYASSHTTERRAMGAIMRAARREGIIAPSGEFRKSIRRICHASPKRVWRSTTFPASTSERGTE